VRTRFPNQVRGSLAPVDVYTDEDEARNVASQAEKVYELISRYVYKYSSDDAAVNIPQWIQLSKDDFDLNPKQTKMNLITDQGKTNQISYLQEQKSNIDVGIQFNYTTPFIDRLDFQSEVHKAGKKLFVIQGDGIQLMNWEGYGLQICAYKGTLSFSEIAEIAVVAVVGGKFEFPKRTQLVSAIYAISVSKPLNEPLRLDIQHCVNITRSSQIKYLKFVTASLDTQNLPYKFEVIEGGKFTANNFYGSIHRQNFSFFAIVADDNDMQPVALLDDPDSTSEENEEEFGTPSDEIEEEGTPSDEDEIVSITTTELETQNNITTDNESYLQRSVTISEETLSRPIQSESSIHESELGDVNFARAIKLLYAGVKFDKKKQDDDFVMFAVTKRLDVLLKYIKDNHPQADIEPCFQFSFKSSSDNIELIFDDTCQKDPCTGWVIRPLIQPCRLLKLHIDNFGNEEPPVPASCLISIYSENTPNTVPVLNYGILLEGIEPPMTIVIHRVLKTTASTSTPLQVASSGVQSTPSTKDVNIKQLIQVIEEVLQTHHANLTNLLKDCHQELADQLFASRLISTTVKNNPSMDKCISEFSSSLKWLKQQSKIQSHCTKFLKSFVAVGGSYSTAAEVLREDLIETVNKQLNCDFQLNL
jgi:hypothetical protein